MPGYMKSENFIVDRIEGESIVLEDSNGEIILIGKENIEAMPNEGDILIKVNNIYKVDKEATEIRRKKIRDMMKGMWAE